MNPNIVLRELKMTVAESWQLAMNGDRENQAWLIKTFAGHRAFMVAAWVRRAAKRARMDDAQARLLLQHAANEESRQLIRQLAGDGRELQTQTSGLQQGCME